jgi:hypothetical protein
MKKQLKADTRLKKYLAGLFRVSQRTVYYALGFDSSRGNTIIASKIRKAAREHGAQLVYTLPECETIYNADGKMIQTFQNGAKIIADKESGKISIAFDKTIIYTEDNCSISDFGKIQDLASKYKKGGIL